jgi:hypothetical protein
MQYELPGTLARLATHPLREKRKIMVTAKQLATVLLAQDKQDATAYPDFQAVRFYALNQMVAILSQKFTVNEKLPDWARDVVVAYERELVSQHRRLTWYTFLVISREFRHLKNPAAVFKKTMYSQGVKDLIKYIKDSTSEGDLNTWLAQVPEDPLDKYAAQLTNAFNVGSWSSGYGGKPWGKISETFGRYMAGETSAEIFIDTAYTLAHNNGPMFNKGMLYMMYGSNFLTVLDVQRAGMICEGLIDGQLQSIAGTKAGAKKAGLSDVEALAKEVKLQTGEIGDYIDWYKVKDLGAVTYVDSYKSEQDKKYGKKPQVQMINNVPVKLTGQQFEVFPGQSVAIYERLKA